MNLSIKYKDPKFLIGFISIGISLIAFATEIYELFLIPIGIFLFFLFYFNHRFYMILLCGLVPLSTYVKDVGGGFGLSIPTEPMIWIAFLIYTLYYAVNLKIDKNWFKNPLTLLIIVNTFWMLMTVIFSTMPFVSLKYWIARLWFIITFFVILNIVFKDRKNIIIFLKIILLTTTIVASITLFKHYFENFSRHWGYMIMKPFFQDHTIYGAFLAFVFPIAIMFTFRGHFLGIKKWEQILYFIITLILTFAIIFSYTRAAWISLLAAYAFYFLTLFKIRFSHLIYLLIAGVVFAFYYQDKLLYNLERNKQGSADDLESHAQSVSNITTDPSNQERVNRWNCAILMFKEKPIFGFGPGTYTFQYAPFQRPEQLTLISTHSGDLGNTHSEYFNSLSETGLIGFLSWVGIFLASIFISMKLLYNENVLIKDKIIIATVLSGLITYYVHGLLNNYSDFDKIACLLWGFLAIVYRLNKNQSIKQV